MFYRVLKWLGLSPFQKQKQSGRRAQVSPAWEPVQHVPLCHRKFPSWLRGQGQRNRESHGVIPTRHSCPAGLTRLLCWAAHGLCSSLNTQYPRSGGAARGTHCSPSPAGRALLPDRFMAALCEQTRCRPSPAPSWLLNQQEPDKAGGTRSAGSGEPGGAAPGSAHLPLPVPGSAGLPGGPGAPSPRCQARQSLPAAPRHCAALIPGFHTFSKAGPQPPPQTKPTLMR